MTDPLAKELGSRGGKQTLKRYGTDHYRQLQKKSVESRNRNKNLTSVKG
jgi:hypothetical protein